MKAVRKGNALCLYPEGQQTWDGTTLPLIDTTAKLLKLLKVPVIRVLSKGAFSARPRWSLTRRKGRVTLNFKLILKSEDLKKYSVAEIQDIMDRELAYNEWDWLKTQKRLYNNTFGCKNMEKVLYMCPHCGTLSKMKSFCNYFYCTECGYCVRYTNSGLFVSRKHVPYFSDIHSWNVWQRRQLRLFLTGKTENLSEKNAGIPLLQNNASAWTGYRINPMKKYARGRICLYADRLQFNVDNDIKQPLVFSFTEIEGISFMRSYFEFYAGHTLYRFKFLTSAASSLKWTTAISIMSDIYSKKNVCSAEKTAEAR